MAGSVVSAGCAVNCGVRAVGLPAAVGGGWLGTELRAGVLIARQPDSSSIKSIKRRVRGEVCSMDISDQILCLRDIHRPPHPRSQPRGQLCPLNTKSGTGQGPAQPVVAYHYTQTGPG